MSLFIFLFFVIKFKFVDLRETDLALKHANADLQ
jgi:hypothetical protein